MLKTQRIVSGAIRLYSVSSDNIFDIGLSVPDRNFRRHDWVVCANINGLAPVERCVRAVSDLCRANERTNEVDIFNKQMFEFKEILLNALAPKQSNKYSNM